MRRETTGPSQRQLRVGESIRHALAEIFQRGDFHDPALQGVNITVTEVRMTPDLRQATAFVMHLGGQGTVEAVAALNKASAFFRMRVAQAVQLQYAPTVRFRADTSLDYANRIETLLQSPKVAEDLKARSEEAGDEEA